MSLTTRKMSDAHEIMLADLFGGRRTKGSGNQWHNQMDGRASSREVTYAFAWDGKALGLNARILTPLGYVKMGDLRVGDAVVALTGQATLVSGVFPQGVRKMYRITFSDGTIVDATGDHLWSVHQRTTGGSRGAQRSVVIDRVWTTDRLMSLSDDMLGAVWLPSHGSVDFEETSSLPIRPYVLGALLGDGSINSGSAILTSADPEIPLRVESELPSGMTLVRFAERPGCAHYRIKGQDSTGRYFGDLLWEAGVSRVVGHLKAIPEPYLTASVDDRWALLQGLLDTDGWAEKGAGRFVSTSEVLRDQVAWIARSLGLRVNTYTRATPTYRSTSGEKLSGREAYQASIGYHPDLFYLSRKRDLLHRSLTRTFHRSFVSIEPIGEAETQCISVDADDGVFLIEDFVPTHNSTLGRSVGVTRVMWDKAVEQALPERPMLALRWYSNERLDVALDLVVMTAYDAAEIIRDANKYRALTIMDQVN